MTAAIPRDAPEFSTTGNPGVALRQDDAAASGTRSDTPQDLWAHAAHQNTTRRKARSEEVIGFGKEPEAAERRPGSGRSTPAG